jgi:hypothetical protein
MEMIENSLRESAKIVITENGISPTLLLGSLPVTVWIIALSLGGVGILANLVALPVITPALGFWLVVLGWVLLLIATMISGL